MHTIFQIFNIIDRGVSDVFGVIHIPQICQSVVGSYPIYVIHLRFAFYRLKKSFGNQSVYFSILTFYSYYTVSLRML